MACKKPLVWAVPGRSTSDGKARVSFAVDGNLNKGNRQSFKSFSDAKKFARKKAKEYGVKAQIHPD